MKLILVALSLVASAPTAPDTFAIACSGETFSNEVQDGKITEKKFSLPDQIFVFSESAKVALRAMPRRQEFENLCEIGPVGKEVEFSTGMIRVNWVGPSDWEAKTTCEFNFDRVDNKATMRTKIEWSNSHHRESEWRMICKPTQIPVFDPEER